MQKRKNGNLAGNIGASVLQAVVSLIPFVAVFYFFIPLQAYTHWAFRTYWWLIWIAPLTGLIHLLLRRNTWRERFQVIGMGFVVWAMIVAVLAFSWGTYTG